MQFIFNLGHQQDLSLAELYSVYGVQNITLLAPGFATLESDQLPNNLDLLGGTYKVSGFLKQINLGNWPNIIDDLSSYIKENKDLNEKIVFGLSFYHSNHKVKEIHKIGFQIKKTLLKDLPTVRYVANQELGLNSAQIINNKLLIKNNVEVNLIFDHNKIWLTKTLFVQNISKYSARDFNRPYRDPRNGMLPPKLAQIIVNIASLNNPKTILDPFCGTGVILQEALLMGNSVVGSDLNPRMVSFSQKNIAWLKSRFKINSKLNEEYMVGDATKIQWPYFDCVASETSLGAPLSNLPNQVQLAKIVKQSDVLVKSFLINLAQQAQPGCRICIAIPVWRLTDKQFKKLTIIDQIHNLGYNLIEFKDLNNQNLIYIRPNQVVGRQLLALTRK